MSNQNLSERLFKLELMLGALLEEGGLVYWNGS